MKNCKKKAYAHYKSTKIVNKINAVGHFFDQVTFWGL